MDGSASIAEPLDEAEEDYATIRNVLVLVEPVTAGSRAFDQSTIHTFGSAVLMTLMTSNGFVRICLAVRKAIARLETFTLAETLSY